MRRPLKQGAGTFFNHTDLNRRAASVCIATLEMPSTLHSIPCGISSGPDAKQIRSHVSVCVGKMVEFGVHLRPKFNLRFSIEKKNIIYIENK
jgi:hypothetical protein